MNRRHKSPAAACVLRGYQSSPKAPLLTDVEVLFIRTGMLARCSFGNTAPRTHTLFRLAHSLTFGYVSALENPDNAEYLLYSAKTGWEVLDLLLSHSDESLLEALKCAIV